VGLCGNKTLSNRSLCDAFNSTYCRAKIEETLPFVDGEFSHACDHVSSLGKIYCSSANTSLRIWCFGNGLNVAQPEPNGGAPFRRSEYLLSNVISHRFRKLLPSKSSKKPPSRSPLGALLRAVQRALSALFLPLLKQVTREYCLLMFSFY
jgi:hypothetical protein